MTTQKEIAKIIKTEKSNDGNSYLIDFGDGMTLWFDTWQDQDGEFSGDWNKYIFHLDDEEDLREHTFQYASNDESGAYNFMTAMELCELEETEQA